ncbi:penicillin-binding protein activator [Oceanomicrobium pacificus]|uniref:ABC transporter substrate-binding protein n=1 Tax=Oceanomicrobium pacificus TaxID=2692916 RepID=A0A6B0TJB9_9RHOB|nr:penicillin-binding protein activator [Oceanomicrobium pacificus]MXU64477.1 ABC transporter substrate-binding protein [Oceanomicrobium pacificus]
MKQTLLRPFRLVPALLALATLGLAGCDVATGPTSGARVDPAKPVKVALLVPLGSDDVSREQLAQSLVNAARMAQSDLSGVEIELTTYSTQGTAEGARAAATKAVEEGATVFLGPLFSSAAPAAAEVARPKGIPVFSLSNNSAIAGNGLYLLGVTFEDVANRVVSYGVGQGLSRVAAVHPDSLEGRLGRDAVEAAAARSGATFTGASAYPLSFNGISSAAGSIAAGLTAQGAQAVVLTDTPTGGLPFIASSLRAEGLSPRDAQYLGLTRWDASREVMQQPSLRGGWFALPDPGLGAAFATRYEGQFGVPPHELSGLAYDGIAAIGTMLRDARAAGDQTPFSSDRITDPSGFAGVTGIFRFRDNGGNERGLAVMQVGEGGIATVIAPAPRSFAAEAS